jgi:hypothetical protein
MGEGRPARAEPSAGSPATVRALTGRRVCRLAPASIGRCIVCGPAFEPLWGQRRRARRTGQPATSEWTSSTTFVDTLGEETHNPGAVRRTVRPRHDAVVLRFGRTQGRGAEVRQGAASLGKLASGASLRREWAALAGPRGAQPRAAGPMAAFATKRPFATPEAETGCGTPALSSRVGRPRDVPSPCHTGSGPPAHTPTWQAASPGVGGRSNFRGFDPRPGGCLPPLSKGARFGKPNALGFETERSVRWSVSPKCSGLQSKLPKLAQPLPQQGRSSTVWARASSLVCV